jgi:hypothetical protein
MFEAAKAVKVLLDFTPKSAKYKDKEQVNNTRLKFQSLRSPHKQSSLPRRSTPWKGRNSRASNCSFGCSAERPLGGDGERVIPDGGEYAARQLPPTSLLKKKTPLGFVSCLKKHGVPPAASFSTFMGFCIV